MKKILLIMALATVTLGATAQASKNRMRIMLGLGIPNLPASALSNVDTKTGPLQIGYKVFLTERLSVGLMYNYASAKTKPMIDFDDNLNPYIYTYDVKFSTFLTQLDFAWVNRPTHNWYSGVSFGTVSVSAKAEITSGSGNPSFTAAKDGLAYHLTLVGYHGTIGKGFGLYSELGFGYNGIWNGGLTYSFN